MSEQKRANGWMAVLVIVVAVIGFAFAGVVAELPAASAAGHSAAPAGGAAAAISSGALTPIKGSASGLSSAQPTPFGTFTVLPAPEAFNPSAPDAVTVTLTPSASLDTFVNEINNVASPEYRHFLSASALGAEFGNSAYASTVAYFEGYGLSVETSATLLTLQVSGTVAEIAAAFHTNLASFVQQYQSNGIWNPSFGAGSGIAGSMETGPTFYSNSAPAELPQGIAAVVNGITGLDGISATPTLVMPAGLYPGMDQNNSSGPLCQFGVFGACPQSLDENQQIQDSNFLWTDFSSAGGTCEYYNICGDFQFLFPSTMPDISGADNLWSGATTIDSEPDTGQGATIAVVEVGCAIPSDLSQFSQMVYGNAFELPDRITQIAVNTGHGLFPNTNLADCEDQGFDAGWTAETSLDIEYASTMAPNAHIDVIGIPYPGYFSDFDQAYADIAQYLALGSTGGVCADNATLQAAGLYVVDGSLTGGCGVTITSNSYGEGEEYQYFEGSPMYISAEDEELDLLNSVGVTNFFASGDSGGTYETVNDFAAADSPGATSVGGAQLTAEGDGSEFPVTANNFTYCDGEIESTTCYGVLGDAYWAPASGLGGAAYWSYGEGLNGTYTGVVGGGFGQSLVDPQPWWQNAADTYSTAAKIDPVISGAAAFNMTIYVEGEWLIFYGGTSFATPIQAGEWALVEEQANVAFGTPEMGDVNPILYSAHNAYEAGALATNPYTPMAQISDSYDSAPVNSFTWYYYNLSIEVPSAPVQPIWFASLGNPAGSGWNYLQGLGIPNVAELDQALLGETGVAGHSLADPAFSLFIVTVHGVVPLTNPTLTAGTAYTFEVLDATGQSGVYNVEAYSGQSNAGAYGGGTLKTLQTGSNGRFTYTPTTGTPPGGDAATTYGYFLVTSVVGPHPEWSFLDYAVQAPTPQGTLSLCVVDPYGVCDSGAAETTMFTTTAVGDYNVFGESQVWLNGLPISGAVVTQVAYVSQYGELDPTLPPADYAPGTAIGDTLSDSRGEATFWTDALVAEHNGSLYTDVYTLTATYDGLVSNTVTVFVEPQSGSFYTGDLGMNMGGTAIVGDLSFAGMKYAAFVNISVGGGPGQYDNYTCPLPAGAGQPANTLALPGCSPFEDTQFGADVWESGVDSGTLPVDLNVMGMMGPVVVSVLAEGANDVSFGYCESFDGESFCFFEHAVQKPIIWQDPIVFLPASISASLGTAAVTGDDTISWTGTPLENAAGVELASGTLSLVSGTETTVLATGLSGSFVLDTANYLDGAYSVVFTETAPGAATVTRSVSLYADNQEASLSSLVTQLQSQVSADQQTIAALQATVASLQTSVAYLEAGWSAANATLASDQAQIDTLNGQISSLQAQLSTAQASIASLSAQVSTLTAQVASLQAQLASSQGDSNAEAAQLAALEAELTTAQSQLATANGALTSDVAQIASLQSTVTQLQSELNDKKGTISPAWYDTFPGGGLVVAILFGVVGAVLAGLAVGIWSRRRPESGSASPGRGISSREPPNANAVPAVDSQETGTRGPNDRFGRPWGSSAQHPALDGPANGTGRGASPDQLVDRQTRWNDSDTMYR